MMKKYFNLLFVIFIICYLCSCDILRTSPFEVTSWTPGGRYHPEPEKITVSLNFSHDPDRASVERYFILTGDENRVNGAFLWNGRKMTFVPLVSLEKNTDYAVSLSTGAHDTDGLSLDTAFERRFSTRPGTARPVLLSCYPSMYAEIDDIRAEVRLYFSRSVPISTLYNNVSFSPSMTGSWRLEDDGNTAVFTPAEPWIQNRRYEIRVAASLTDNKRADIGKDFLSVFTVGTDHEAPSLLYAYRITGNNDYAPLELDTGGYTSASEPLIETKGWEKEDRFSLVFSKPVDSSSLKNCLSVEGSPGLIMETEPGYKTEFVFRFETRPVYESRFVFRLKTGVKDNAGNESENEYIYRIFANGASSKPPELAGIRIPMAPGNGIDRELISFGTDSLFENIPITEGRDNYPSGESVKTWIELYFTVAHGASIDRFSLMELFRIETSNNVLTFSPRQIKTGGFSAAEPQTGWENFERIEIAGILTNSTNFGIVNFQISPGLMDSLGNKSEKQFRISLVK